MTKITHLSGTWQQWIQDNLARGCTHASLVEAMVRDNFDSAFAISSVYQLANQPAAPVAAVQIAAQADYVNEPPRMTHQGNIIQTDDRAVRLAFRMDRPVVALVENLFSDEECDELIRLARIKLKPSTIIDPQTGREEVIEARSSEGTFFALNENDFIARLDRRIAQVMNWPIENGEGLQILHYNVGGEYRAHFDYFPPEDPGSQAHIARGGQRVSTMVMYLNDVPGGGETVFPTLDLSVTARKGSAVYFEYCNSRGQIDPQSLHGGLPVTHGEKWIATKWMRQRRYG